MKYKKGDRVRDRHDSSGVVGTVECYDVQIGAYVVRFKGAPLDRFIYLNETRIEPTTESAVEEGSRKAVRKDMPLFSGCLMYFPDALLAISEHSKKGNDKHNPGQPLHWSKGKSSDQADCIARHLIDIGPNWDAMDPELGSLHATALAWRALALLQTVLEKKKEKL